MVITANVQVIITGLVFKCNFYHHLCLKYVIIRQCPGLRWSAQWYMMETRLMDLVLWPLWKKNILYAITPELSLTRDYNWAHLMLQVIKEESFIRWHYKFFVRFYRWIFICYSCFKTTLKAPNSLKKHYHHYEFLRQTVWSRDKVWP